MFQRVSAATARGRDRCALAVCAFLYLAVSLWTVGDALFADEPSLLVSFQGTKMGLVQIADQRMVLSGVAMDASRMLHQPFTVGEYGQCFPIERPFRLGEHGFGTALVTAPFLGLGLDPARALTLGLATQRWLGAFGMFLLARRLTGSMLAGFVSGFLFGFGHNRLADPVHPFVWGDHWMPYAMLFLHRLMDRERWSDAIALAGSVSLMLGESIYALIPGAIVGTIWFGYLAWRARARLPSLSLKIVAVLIPPALLAWMILGPYLSAEDVVRFQSGVRLYVLPEDYAPGRVFFPGFVPLVLAVAGLLARPGQSAFARFGDPRPWIALAGLGVWLCAIEGVPIPGTSATVPSPLVVGRDWLPLLDAVRALPSISSGAYLSLSLLAAFGVHAITRRLPAAGGAAVAAALSLLWLGELYAPALGRTSFGTEITVEPVPFALSDGDRALAARVTGPVVEIPRGAMRNVGDSLLLAAHHRQPVETCHQSHGSPYLRRIGRLAEALPDPNAAAALAGLGFANVLVHRHDLRGDAEERIDRLRSGSSLALVAESDDHLLFRLRAPDVPAVEEWKALQMKAGDFEADSSGRGTSLSMELTNPTELPFVHPKPLERVLVKVRWRDRSGETTATFEERVNLPAALLPGATARIRVPIAIRPPPASATVEIEMTVPGRALSASAPAQVATAASAAIEPAKSERPVRAVRVQTDPAKWARIAPR